MYTWSVRFALQYVRPFGTRPILVACAQVPATGFPFVLSYGDTERTMTYTVRPRLSGGFRRLWTSTSMRGISEALNLLPGDVITLTRPPVWSRDGTSRMGMTVDRANHAQPDVTAIAAATGAQTFRQRFAEGSQPEPSSGSGSRAELFKKPVRIVLGWAACQHRLQLTEAQAAALMPPDDQVPSQTSK